MRIHKLQIFTLLSLSTLAGCAELAALQEGSTTQRYAQDQYGRKIEQQHYRDGQEILSLNQQAIEKLTSQLQSKLSKEDRIIVTTVSDIHKLETTSALGRLISENIASNIVQKGYHVGEIRLREEIVVQNNTGEFILTRKAKELGESLGASAVVAGSYSSSPYQVFVNVRLIRLSDNKILGASDYVLPMNSSVRAMTAASSSTSNTITIQGQ